MTDDALGAAKAAEESLPISPSQGLTVLKEMWQASSRLALLVQQSGGKPIPLDKVFGALLGIGGDKPNPLAEVEKQLKEINAKLDRVLAGIQEIQAGLLGLGVLTVYLDIADAVALIERYSELLATYGGVDPSVTSADRKQFVDKLIGVHSERDSVAFLAQKIIKLGAQGSPLLFDLLFPYVSLNATAATSEAQYLRGAFAFRYVTDALLKAMLLELFAVTAVGEQRDMSARAEKVTRRYRGWIRSMVDRSFLPFAERLATLRFTDEFLGKNDLAYDANRLLERWTATPSSILCSADDLVARLMGYSKGVTLRVLPNIPPIADVLPSANDPRVVSPGKNQWEVVTRPSTTLTRDSALDKMQKSVPPFFYVKIRGRADALAQNVSRADIAFMDGAPVPPGFVKTRLAFLRFEFDLGPVPDRTLFSVYLNPAPSAEFPFLTVKWRRVYVEDGHRFPERNEPSHEYHVLDRALGEFEMPSGGQLSPVLITYAYNMFGERPGPR